MAALKSEVSRIAGLLDEQVQAFAERPPEGRCPYLFVDAKVRHESARCHPRGLPATAESAHDAPPARASSISTALRTFPVGVSGSWVRKTISRGTL
jgi:hypothetical protein